MAETNEQPTYTNTEDALAAAVMGDEIFQGDEEPTPTGGEPDTEEPEIEEPEDEGEPEEASTWASALGLTDEQAVVDDDGNLVGVRVKIDGEIETVPVADLVRNYQKTSAVDKRFQAFAEERKAFEATRQQVAQEYQARIDVSNRLLRIQEQSLMSEFNSVDWDRLRQENPGEYAAMLRDYEGRKRQLDSLGQALQQEQEQIAREQAQEQQQRFNQNLAQQYEIVMARNPEWQDPKKLQEDLRSYEQGAAEHYGIPPEEFAQLSDARYLAVLQDALAYRRGKSVVDAKLKDKPAPKFVKPGRSGKPMDKLTQIKLNMRRATGSARQDLQKDALAEIMLQTMK